MEKKLILATNNLHKVGEFRQMLAATPLAGVEILSLKDYADYQAPDEDGDSFLANATIKARAAAALGIIALADDSGLCVDALDGAPGIYSARFAGVDADSAANNRKLLDLLAEVPQGQRQAAFHAVIVIATPDGRLFEAEGDCPGEIGFTPDGAGGFGYDPVFYMPQYGCTMAALGSDQKNRISHRARALQKALPILVELFAEK